MRIFVMIYSDVSISKVGKSSINDILFLSNNCRPDSVSVARLFIPA